MSAFDPKRTFGRAYPLPEQTRQLVRLSWRAWGQKMRRRELLSLIGIAAAAISSSLFAQDVERRRRVGILMNRAADDAEGQARLAAFKQAMEQLGWSDGRNMQIDIRWGEDEIDLERKYAAELVALAPDIIVAAGTVSMTALRSLGRNFP